VQSESFHRFIAISEEKMQAAKQFSFSSTGNLQFGEAEEINLHHVKR
jgi:hypothetical protein